MQPARFAEPWSAAGAAEPSHAVSWLSSAGDTPFCRPLEPSRIRPARAHSAAPRAVASAVRTQVPSTRGRLASDVNLREASLANPSTTRGAGHRAPPVQAQPLSVPYLVSMAPAPPMDEPLQDVHGQAMSFSPAREVADVPLRSEQRSAEARHFISGSATSHRISQGDSSFRSASSSADLSARRRSRSVACESFAKKLWDLERVCLEAADFEVSQPLELLERSPASSSTASSARVRTNYYSSGALAIGDGRAAATFVSSPCVMRLQALRRLQERLALGRQVAANASKRALELVRACLMSWWRVTREARLDDKDGQRLPTAILVALLRATTAEERGEAFASMRRHRRFTQWYAASCRRAAWRKVVRQKSFGARLVPGCDWQQQHNGHSPGDEATLAASVSKHGLLTASVEASVASTLQRLGPTMTPGVLKLESQLNRLAEARTAMS
eukprot:TRINITY_DN38326_c0_g1_i1.p1 TRINITY_DN38326_c0_g1~~TRINITY_DN38326_c0_g1_i1.p1  ORF type:complete len:445 (+),score=66.43 TRINITY_DN38326_c0_g1_i1:87-1421(+)